MYSGVTDSIQTGDGDVIGIVLLMLGLLVLIVALPVRLYKVATGKVLLPFATGNDYTEIAVAKLITKSPAFLAAAIFTTILPVCLISVIAFLPEYTLPVLGKLFFYDGVRAFNGFAFVIWFFFSITFSVLLLQIFGLLLVGEFLQRQFTMSHHNLVIHMLKNIIIALPYIILYSLVFVFVIVTRKKDSDSSGFSLRSAAISTFIFASLTALKYYIYANLSAVAFEDKYNYLTQSSSIQYVKSNSIGFFMASTKSAVFSGVVFLYVFVLWIWAGRIPMLNADAIMSLSFAFLGIFLSWMIFVEQVLFLINYIRTQHPYYDIDAFISSK